MNYLISAMDCIVLSSNYPIIKNVKYEFEFSDDVELLMDNQFNLIPFFPNNNKIAKIKYKLNNYYFLFPDKMGVVEVYSLRYNSKQILVQISNFITISIDDKVLCDNMVSEISFSHYEIDKEIIFIYFSGERNYVVVIKDLKLYFAGYCDECNIKENEKYFLMKMRDSLNHGNVCHVQKQEIETYLVYLDDFEMNMKNEFASCVFLDCVLARNFKYANQILCETIRMKKEGEINSFFPCFDNYYLIEENVAVLFNKSQSVAVVEFQVDNCEIQNIIIH